MAWCRALEVGRGVREAVNMEGSLIYRQANDGKDSTKQKREGAGGRRSTRGVIANGL